MMEDYMATGAYIVSLIALIVSAFALSEAYDIKWSKKSDDQETDKK
jgi:hypothetical protein